MSSNTVTIDASALQKEAEKAGRKDKAKARKRGEIQNFLTTVGKDQKITMLEKRFLDLHRELACMATRKKEIAEELKMVEEAMEESGLLGQMEFKWEL